MPAPTEFASAPHSRYGLPVLCSPYARMKTTIEISDTLFARSRKLAQREGKTLRALVEEGLLLTLQSRGAKPESSFDLPVFGEGGLREEFQSAGWDVIRDTLYGTENRFRP